MLHDPMGYFQVSPRDDVSAGVLFLLPLASVPFPSIFPLALLGGAKSTWHRAHPRANPWQNPPSAIPPTPAFCFFFFFFFKVYHFLLKV